ncbi:unnamed protein product [Mytilus edulis]|uniref:B box-type domain-containing protein n=1 Tax=Mytilus edulis TaxID=6550 RepID=A0A8S3SE60_MYTED|nr:unnamed protein product [Mytilus edulis]
MSVYKCYDCNQVLCEDCSKRHDDEIKFQSHSMQPINDKFILKSKFILKILVVDIKCLSNGLLIVIGHSGFINDCRILKIYVNGEQRHVTHLEKNPKTMVVVDQNTVAVDINGSSIALVDIQQNHVQYIRNIARRCTRSFMYIENEFYFGDKYGIVVIDMSGSVKDL